MEGKSQKNGKRIRIHREFECSRIEQATLAAAYRRIIPHDRLKLVERSDNKVDDRDRQSAAYDDKNLSQQYATATGGLSS